MAALRRISAGIAVLGVFFLSAIKLDRIRSESLRDKPELPRYRTEALHFFSLGHKALVSDLLMARGLSFFGAHYQRKEPAIFAGLKELFALAFELDPQNRELILFAANTLTGIDPDEALSLLELGMVHHPDYWKFPEMFGFICYYHLRDSARAARYYARAASLPGHPPFVPSISSKLYEESGFYEQAIAVLRNLARGNHDSRVRQGFEQRAAQLEKRLRMRRFRIPVELRSAFSATRLQLEMVHFNPYPELESLLEMDVSWLLTRANEAELAIILSVWRQWIGKALWMQLHTHDDGQLIFAGEAVSGILQGEGGENICDTLLASIRNCPTVGPGQSWEEYVGQVVRVCGSMRTKTAGTEPPVLEWETAGLPDISLLPQDGDLFSSSDWLNGLTAADGGQMALTGLLGRSPDNLPVLILVHPAQIQPCAPALTSDVEK